jgi:hypothetical protein
MALDSCLRDEYKRYLSIFKLMRLDEDGYLTLSYENWKVCPKEKNTIMPAGLPAYSNAQISGFEKYIAALKATGLVRSILHYEDGTVWLYMKPEAYSSSGALRVCLKEREKMVSCLGHHFIKGHDSLALAYGRRKGKKTREEVVL